MNAKRLAYAILLVPFLTLPALTQPVVTLPPAVEERAEAQAGKDQPKAGEKGKEKDKDKKAPEKKVTDAPDTDIFTQTPAPLRDALGFNPHMMGDFYGTFARKTISVVGIQTTTITIPAAQTGVPPGTDRPVVKTTSALVTGQRTLLIPSPGHGAFKIAENASPLPVDRVFFTYNFFNGIRSSGDANPPLIIQQRTTSGPSTKPVYTDVTTSFPAVPAPAVDLNREVFGFEKTFLDGRASFEFRLPLFQQPSGLDDFRAAHVGDITLIGKYALYLDRTTGNVFSGGVALTLPTGSSIDTLDGRFKSTLVQPWVGYIYNFDDIYLHAFHSVVMPSDPRDVALLFNDVGFGYWLYRSGPDRFLSFVVPTVEAHVTTPISNRSEDSPITVPNLVVVTSGVHVGLFRSSILSIGFGAPVTGPRPYAFESFVQFNRRF